MAEQADTRTLQALAREAMAIQNACNVCGLAQSFGRAMSRLLALESSTVKVNTHVITRVWLDKMCSLSGVHFGSDGWALDAYREVENLAADLSVAPAAVESADAAADTQPAAAQSFDETLAAWVARSQARIDAEHARAYPNSKQEPRKLSLDTGGVRWVRVVATDGPSRSAFAFIERETGSIMKAASWKSPAKGARGNIYTDERGVASTGELYR